MNSKIVGFAIAATELDITPDIFNVGMTMVCHNINGIYVYLWGIGDIEACVANSKFSLGFPCSEILLDRNVLINIQKDSVVVENDWLGSIPVFYNKEDNIVSTISIYCLKNKKVDKEGFQYFCEFGYSVFEKTIFQEVQFLRYYSTLTISQKEIHITNKPDPMLHVDFSLKTNPDEVIVQIQQYVQRIESNTLGDIILPTSGGYDSRLLTYCVSDKKRIRSFTYGISGDQRESFEVIYAKTLSEIYDTSWQHIELENYLQYQQAWFDLFGFSTHLHGMYHIEFYKNILAKNTLHSSTLLSGIFGDVWAGSIDSIKDISTPEDINELGYTHGIQIDSKSIVSPKLDHKAKKAFFDSNIQFLSSTRGRVLSTIRLKLMLISYLTQLPEYFGIPVWTPFLNFQIAVSMLSLSEGQRKDRHWQKIFFEKIGLNLEDMQLHADKSNILDYTVARQFIFEPLHIETLDSYFDEKRLRTINATLHSVPWLEHTKNRLMFVPKVSGVLRRLGYTNTYLRALYEYYIIKAVEKSLLYER